MTNKMELTDKYLKEKMPQIRQTMNELNVDDEEAVVENIKDEWEVVSKRKSASILPKQVIFNKALGKVAADLGGGSGKKFNVYIFGYSNPRDWNERERTEILTAWESGPSARENLKKAGQIAMIKKHGKKVVVSEVTNWKVSDKSKHYIPIAGKEIKEGELPIPIDSDEDSNNYTFPLGENWSFNIFGLYEKGDAWKPFILVHYDNKEANPNTDKFLPYHYPAFNEYKIVASINEDRTTKDRLSLRYLNGIRKVKKKEYEDERKLSSEEIIYSLVDVESIHSFKKVKDKLDKISKTDPFLVDLDDINEFDEKVLARRDENGERLKTPSGYGKTHFDRYGLGIYLCTNCKKTSQGNYLLKFSDHSGKKNQGFTANYMGEPDFDEHPQEALISFNTTKKPTRWDFENRVAIEDPINGDVNLGTLRGIHVLKHILDIEEE